ncbi:hypothetical protein Tcan_00600, partial [Toxocara canis]
LQFADQSFGCSTRGGHSSNLLTSEKQYLSTPHMRLDTPPSQILVRLVKLVIRVTTDVGILQNQQNCFKRVQKAEAEQQDGDVQCTRSDDDRATKSSVPSTARKTTSTRCTHRL